MNESIKGTPTNITHGTNVIVSKNVLWYKWSADSAWPNIKRNNVIEG